MHGLEPCVAGSTPATLTKQYDVLTQAHDGEYAVHTISEYQLRLAPGVVEHGFRWARVAFQKTGARGHPSGCLFSCAFDGGGVW